VIGIAQAADIKFYFNIYSHQVCLFAVRSSPSSEPSLQARGATEVSLRKLISAASQFHLSIPCGHASLGDK